MPHTKTTRSRGKTSDWRASQLQQTPERRLHPRRQMNGHTTARRTAQSKSPRRRSNRMACRVSAQLPDHGRPTGAALMEQEGSRAFMVESSGREEEGALVVAAACATNSFSPSRHSAHASRVRSLPAARREHKRLALSSSPSCPPPSHSPLWTSCLAPTSFCS